MKTSNISKKDIVFSFIIIYLLSAMVVLMVWRANTTSELLNQISLGSSVSSILLAVIAIAYAFIESKSSSVQNALVQSNLEKIGDRLNELKEVKNELTTYRNEVTSFKEDARNSTSNLFNALKEMATGQFQTSLVNTVGTNDGVNPISNEESLKSIIKIFENELYQILDRESRNIDGTSIFKDDKIINRICVFLTTIIDIQNKDLKELIGSEIAKNIIRYRGVNLPEVYLHEPESDSIEKIIVLTFVHGNIIFINTVRDLLNGLNGTVYLINNITR